MAKRLQIMVCDTAQKAMQARTFLLKDGFTEAQITDEKVDHFVYDAATYDGGTSDNLVTKIVVIGRM